MKPVNDSRVISASAQSVFLAIADIENLPQARPHILSIEFLSDQKSGVGTRYRETRRKGKGTEQTELEVTELVENEKVRLVSNAGGTIWDTTFAIAPLENQVRLDVTMEIQPYNFLAKLFIPWFRGAVVKGVAFDLDCIKSHCERDRSTEA